MKVDILLRTIQDRRERNLHIMKKKIAQKAITVNIFQKQKQSKDLGHVKI